MRNNADLGAHLKLLRKTKGLGLKTLAASVRIDQAHLSRIESGKSAPSPEVLKKLCRRLNADTESVSMLAGRLPQDLLSALAKNPTALLAKMRALAHVEGASLVRDRSDQDKYPELREYRVIDLFSGAGGFTRGLTETGRFKSVFANDFEKDMAATYNYNFGDHCHHGDINRLLADRSFELPEADIVIGGPPCQGFSLLNKKRAGDSRKALWRAYMDVVTRVKPLVFVMENVPELLASGEFQEIQEMARAKALGYKLVWGVLNAADYGVPQRRRRAIIIGARFGVPALPKPTHYDPRKEHLLRKPGMFPWETVERHIGGLPKPTGITHRVGETTPPMDLHFGRTPLATSRERYACVPEGGNRFDLLRRRPDLTPPCWVRKKSGGTDLFGRLWKHRPAFTIRTEFFKPEKGRYLHPTQDRPITHREAARLQSFPDDFIFQGTNVSIARQIGNAVPPLLGQRIGEAVIKTLDDAIAAQFMGSILSA